MIRRRHLSIARPLKVAGVAIKELTIAPFKASSESMGALLGGHIDVVSATAPVIPKMEDLEGWYQRGYDDFVAGLAFNKYPPVLKEDGYLEAKQSWMDGYSTAKKKAPKKD